MARYGIKINRFDGGLNTKVSPELGELNESPDLLNVDFDDLGAVGTRNRSLRTSSPFASHHAKQATAPLQARRHFEYTLRARDCREYSGCWSVPRAGTLTSMLEAKAMNSDQKERKFPTSAGVFLGLGLGLGGFFDGIVLHQILQWHHMLSSAGYPITSVENLTWRTPLVAWKAPDRYGVDGIWYLQCGRRDYRSLHPGHSSRQRNCS